MGFFLSHRISGQTTRSADSLRQFRVYGPYSQSLHMFRYPATCTPGLYTSLERAPTGYTESLTDAWRPLR